MKRQQIQKQEQTTAFQKQTTYNMLFMTLEWLEKYIEVAYGDYFPNWQSRKQMRDNNIKREDIDGNPAMAEDSLSTQLVLFRSTLKTKPPFLREEIKQEYYKWISAAGIDANNCPERLKHFLFGINEIIEGKGEKILEDLRKEQAAVDSTSPEFMGQMQKLFAYSHSESKKVEKVEKSLEGKTYKDIEIESKFGSGDVEGGEGAFNQITSSVASRHGEFHFFPQNSPQVSGYLTTHGAMINNEPYDEIPANSIQATPEQVGEVNRLAQNNSNEMKWIPVGIAGSGLVALVVSGIVKVFRPSLR